MNTYHLDFETYSAVDIRSMGAYRYISDPSAEILMMAVARNMEEPLLWVNPRWECPELFTDDGVFELLEEIRSGDCPVYAHNAQFEAAVTKYRWVKDIDKHPVKLHQWRCTAAMARTAALRDSLALCAEDLLLAQQKDKRGGELIKLLSCPQKPAARKGVDTTPYRITPLERPTEWAEFGAYCIQDVRTEQAVHQALKSFELKGQPLETFLLDLRINNRGVPVNVPAVRHARRLVDEAAPDLLRKFNGLTGLNPTQNVKLCQWFQQYGYPHNSLAADLVDPCLEDTSWATDPVAVEALELKSILSFAALKKLDAMENCECGDGYVRGTLKFYGAGTGRWSASLIQPQNYKRPEPEFAKFTGDMYSMICDGCSLTDLKVMYGDNPLGVLASCIRHFIQPHSGVFLDADYAAIEARIVCWLAGQQDALNEYKAGTTDPYVTMAAIIYQVPYARVTKDQRFVGKQAVLGCGFQMWWNAFQAQCLKYGVRLEDDICERAVTTFRNVRDKVAKLWPATEKAAKAAIAVPGKWHPAGPLLKFTVVKTAGKDFLVMRLPSGRNIVYPEPKIEGGKITFYGQIKEKRWGRKSTYGGKLVENATQGVAADIMANGACKAEKLGFEVATLIHDQALGYPRPGYTDIDVELEAFVTALCDLPSWADGLPIIAEGTVSKYYTKD